MNRDIRLDILRSLSIMSVVLIHVSAILDTQKNFEAYYWSTWILSVINLSLFWCIPVFFMLSGALLLGKSDESIHHFYQKRISKILIPTLFWSAFFLLYLVLYQGFTLFNIIGALFKGKPFYHLWFMYAIIGVYVFTPYLRILLANLSQKQTNILIFLVFLFTIGNNDIGHYFDNKANVFSLFITYIGYYILGYTLYKNQNYFREYNKLYALIFVVSTIIFSIISIQFPAISYYFPFIDIEAILLFLYFITSKNKNKSPTFWIQLSSLSFGVYLIHPLFILLIAPYWTMENLIYMPFVFLLVLALSNAVVYIFQKIKYLKNIV